MADDFQFRSFLLQVSKQMSSNDFGQLKYLLKGYVSNAKCEEIKAVCEYFEELERLCLLSPKNFGVLKKALGIIGRQDLVEEIEQKEQYFAHLFRDKKGDSLGPKGLCLVIVATLARLNSLFTCRRSVVSL
jgi:hypothetical protein